MKENNYEIYLDVFADHELSIKEVIAKYRKGFSFFCNTSIDYHTDMAVEATAIIYQSKIDAGISSKISFNEAVNTVFNGSPIITGIKVGFAQLMEKSFPNSIWDDEFDPANLLKGSWKTLLWFILIFTPIIASPIQKHIPISVINSINSLIPTLFIFPYSFLLYKLTRRAFKKRKIEKISIYYTLTFGISITTGIAFYCLYLDPKVNLDFFYCYLMASKMVLFMTPIAIYAFHRKDIEFYCLNKTQPTTIILRKRVI